jgi:4-amino-4-deoxy-L-arabinose transferase-like glycosyltransferase
MSSLLKRNGNTRDSSSQFSTRIAVVIVLVALLVRGVVCFTSIDQYSQDPDAYLAIAKTLADKNVFGITRLNGEIVVTAYRPPLYPYLLSWMIGLGEYLPYGIAALHTILGAVTVLCTFRASRRLLNEGQQTRASILAAALVLVDPVLLQQSRWTMTETLATALASLVIWWWVRWAEWSKSFETALVLGTLLGLAYFCRPTFIVWGLMLSVCMGFAKPFFPTSLLMRWARAVLVAAVLVLCVNAWMYRNSREIKAPVWATTHGGYTLLLANNPSFYDYLRNGELGSTWDAEPFFRAYSHRYDGDPNTAEFWAADWQDVGKIPNKVTEPQDDRVANDAAINTIKREPAMFVWASLVRVANLWSPFPHRTSDRSWLTTIPVGIYYLAFYAAVFVGLRRLRGEVLLAKWWPILTLVLALTAVHAVYWTNIRMRAPVMPGLAIVAAAAMRRRPEEVDA